MPSQIKPFPNHKITLISYPSIFLGLLEREYDINLSLTAILSKLAQLPNPFLHEFLLNPTIPVAAGARTMHGILNKILERVKEETKDIDQLQVSYC